MIHTIGKAIYRLAALLIVTLGILALLLLELNPSVDDIAAPTSSDVVEARAFFQAVNGSSQAGQLTARPVITTEAQLDSVVRLASRFTPGFRGDVTVGQTDVQGQASIPIPYTHESLWLNVSATVPSFDQSLSLSRVKLGKVSLPPDLVLEAARRGANILVGGGFGDRLIGAASSMVVDEHRLIFALNLGGLGNNGIMPVVFRALRGAELPSTKDFDRYYVMIREAMDRGDLPTDGSFLPYIHFTLKAALDSSRGVDGPNAYTAALFALTRACGAEDFALVVGDVLGGDVVASRHWATDCSQLTLNGRIDSRRHFTTAAALQAASNRGFSVTVGELKELYDKTKSGGFDFTDLAANNSGIRMSNRFMSSPVHDWPRLLARIEHENDIIISFDDIPQIMSEQKFRTNVGTIESPKYHAMLERIEAKIDELSLHND